MRYLRPLLIGVAFALLLAGCATQQTRALLGDLSAVPQPWSMELDRIGFHPQEDHQCGPAALATALEAAGVEISPDHLIEQVYLPEREGSLQVEMLASTRRNGGLPYLLRPELGDLLAEVRAGTPVVVLQNLGLAWFPVWHYAVVVGFDLVNRHIILRSGRERRQVLDLDTFARTWARGGHWAFVVMPAGKLPATAVEADYLASVAALERLGKTHAAQLSYAAALARWPLSLAAAIGLGNTAYARGDLATAEAMFLHASQGHPDSVVALNNLAHVLGQRKRYREALAAARRAVALGGPHMEEARRTLAEIEAAIQP